ncbi:MAG TPA: cupin domain-containing protein [Vicinamibacterales bacterium]|nr:cupin domain-containing protein [Vicinamibacterales bacterium]
MTCSRRDFGLLFPSLLAVQAVPATNNDVEHLSVMKTERFAYDELAVVTNGKNKQRRMFTAKTHTGFKIESHMSDIAPGEVNHPPHQHLREEMMLIREGTMELTIAGKPYRLGPGDVGVIGSNELHNAKNVGATIARYFIVNIGRDDV